jgi:dipeptidyl-peptidase-4
MPETFTVKAADGVTDLYGNMWKPFDFDPKKKYPIIAHVYPGPQTEGVVYRFSAYSTNMQMAQLGFIVIQVGHRGGSPERSKAYHSFGYFNLRDYGLVDKKAAIEALAARHAFIDLNRVGIYGHSGGGFMSAAAVLQKPYNEFFKAAVASAGNHDNNIYNDNWSETYHGLREVPLGTEKKDTTTTTGTGTGTGKGFGGRKKGPSVEDEIERELFELIAGTGPDDQRSAEELEIQLAALKAKLAQLKQGEVALAPPPRPKGTPLPAITLPQTKFEILVPTNAELAANLKGHLLLVHGEIDNNVHPANTMRLTDALIKANKRFDMIIIPGARHAFGPAQPYFTQRMWDFFAEHLLDDRQTGADINIKDVKRRN